MDLQGNPSFEFKDYPVSLLNGKTSPSLVYRVFCVRLASYAEFKLKNALESRGIMFLVDNILNVPIDLVCRPPEKFFNYNENPYTIFNRDILYDIICSEVKVDGSLISTYTDIHGSLQLKSKTSVNSDVQKAARKTLCSFHELKKDLEIVTKQGWTVNLEYTSMTNRIILEYQNDMLTVLNIRNVYTGEYMPISEIHKYKGITQHLVEHNPKSFTDAIQDAKERNRTFNDVVQELKKEQQKEGYIVKLPGLQFKLKNDWYCEKHSAKDAISSNRKLFELIINEKIDDYIPLFYDTPSVINRINRFQEVYSHEYNKMIQWTTDFYESNKHLEIKEYAQEVRNSNCSLAFSGIVFSLKRNRKVNYKEVFIKQWDKLRDLAPSDEYVDSPLNQKGTK